MNDEEEDHLRRNPTPAQSMGLNVEQENETGRVYILFLDRTKERELCFMASAMEEELDLILDTFQPSEGYSAFVARKIMASGQRSNDMMLDVAFVEWVFGTTIDRIVATARDDNEPLI